jgi:type IV pilus assembly protein PilA
MRKNNKGFTLIELLAIIVILAIIAVITVPIILNIIENSRKGAATDSAYGFKDSINKYYITKLADNRQFQLEGEYTIIDGKLKGNNIEENGVEIPISGTIPSSGSLTYSNNTLTEGCLVIGEYAVTFKSDGTTSTEKGKCIPKIPTCPGCVFVGDSFNYSVSQNYFTQGSPAIVKPNVALTNYTNNYTEIVDSNNYQRNYFIGFILNSDETINRYFACGIEKGIAFCLENGSSDFYDNNEKILKEIFGETNCEFSPGSVSNLRCTGDDILGFADESGRVFINPNNYYVLCGDGYGSFYCSYQ